MPNWIGRGAVLGRELPREGENRRWSATLDSGRPALALARTYGSPAEVQRAGDRLRRLLVHPHDGLERLLAWAVEGGDAWALTEAEPGVSLRSLVRSSGPLDADLVAAAGWRILSGLEVLHAAGLAHRSVDADHVFVSPSGGVHLGGHLLGEGGKAGPADLAADVEGAGRLLCEAMDVPVRRTGEPTAAETAAPALARTLRAIASGATGGNVAGARSALGASAPALVDADAMDAATRRLSALVLGGSPASPAAEGAAGPVESAPAPPPEPARSPRRVPGAPVEIPRPSGGPVHSRYVATAEELRAARRGGSGNERPRSPARSRPSGPPGPALRLPALKLPSVPWQVPIAAGAVLLVVAIGWMGIRGLGARQPSAAGVAQKVATPAPSSPAGRPTAAPSARPTPPFPPAAAGAVRSIEVQAPGGCAPGGGCSADVTVNTVSAGGTVNVSWVIRVFDPCTGQTVDAGSGGVTEQPGWNHVIGSTPFQLPAAHGALQWAAVTTSPDAAASPVQTAGQGGC